ncbi:MAG: hypothetical protein ONB15_06420 [candidate division KSB1 bacterium]|nr:hypothetical protein [candidate division KSB1 bacterium]
MIENHGWEIEHVRAGIVATVLEYLFTGVRRALCRVFLLKLK